MGKKSRDKGKVGEREFAALLREHGFNARRGVQYQGGPDSPDIQCDDLGEYHIEVKRCENLSLYKAVKQAIQDAGEKIPIIGHRRNNQEWLCIMKADDLLDLIKGAR